MARALKPPFSATSLSPLLCPKMLVGLVTGIYIRVPLEIEIPQSDQQRTLTLSKSHAAFGLEVTLLQKESITS